MRNDTRALIAEAEVAEFLAPVAKRAPEVLATFPRDIELILQILMPIQIEHVHDLTLQKALDLLAKYHEIRPKIEVPGEPARLGAFLYARGRCAVVFLETQYRERYMRFSLCHEAGHFWQKHARFVASGEKRPEELLTIMCRSPKPQEEAEQDDRPHQETYPEEESAADAFAAEMLMPRADVISLLDKRFCEGDWRTEDVLEAMCPRYNVSDWAAARRLRDLERISKKEYLRVRDAILRRLKGEDTLQDMDQTLR